MKILSTVGWQGKGAEGEALVWGQIGQGELKLDTGLYDSLAQHSLSTFVLSPWSPKLPQGAPSPVSSTSVLFSFCAWDWVWTLPSDPGNWLIFSAQGLDSVSLSGHNYFLGQLNLEPLCADTWPGRARRPRTRPVLLQSLQTPPGCSSCDKSSNAYYTLTNILQQPKM